MKKLLTYLFLALSLVTLAACGKNEAAKLTSSTNNHQSKVQGQVTLILKTEKESKKKSVEIQKGDTVLDVLEEVYPVQENDGFITEIDGISQDKDKGIYYVSDQNYPFAIHLSDVESFSTTEKEAIDKSYPRFASWAQSGGTTDKDWYLKK